MKNTFFKEKLLLLVCFFVCIAWHGEATAQQIGATFKLQGVVYDAQNQPLIGCTVTKKAGHDGVTTSAGGKFSISVKDGDVLIFSFIGFTNKEVKINNQTSIKVTMEENRNMLDEVQVIGYGTIKKGNLTTSISKVNGDDLSDMSVSRVENALDGQLAGVQVQQSSGVPGAAPDIRVRGVGSISASTSPLYVIDGIAIDDPDVVGSFSMNDILSLEVLKDASAAAIYGSRGSNGVILITTKQGKEGAARVDLKLSTGIQSVFREIEMMDGPGFLKMYFEANPSFEGKEELLAETKTYNHLDYILKTALRQNYQLSVSGGTKKVKYLTSMNYLDQEGVVKNTSFDVISGRISVQAEVQKWFKLGFNLSPSYTKKVDKKTENKEGTIYKLMIAPPCIPTLAGSYGNPDYRIGTLQSPRSGVAMIDDYEYSDKRYQLVGDITADVIFTKGLNYRMKLGMTYVNSSREDFSPETVTISTPPRGAYWGGTVLRLMMDNILTYDFKVGKSHNFNTTLVYSAQKNSSFNQFIEGSDFPSELIHTLNMAGTIKQNTNTTKTEDALLSYVARVNYDFRDKVLLSVSFRRDGSSRFPNNKWGNFFAASAGWKISEEGFFKSIKPVMNQLKLRVSYGETGNNRVGDYASYGLLASGSYITGADENKVNGFYPNNIANPNLTWEKKRSMNYGIDFGFLNNRISGSIDYYNQDTRDLLLTVPVPALTGFVTMADNVGSVNNKGVEFEVTSRNLVKKFKWETNFNIAFNKNEVTSLGTTNQPIIGGDGTTSVSLTKVGQPIGMFYLKVADGIFMNSAEAATLLKWPGAGAGDVRIKDINGDNLINDDDRTIVGSAIPTYNWGLTNKFTYKNFQFSILVTGKGGNKIYNAFGRHLDSANNAGINQYKFWENRWKSEDEPGDGKVPRVKGSSVNLEPTTRWIYDGTYARISNMTLSYTFGKSILSKIKLSTLRIYVAADNVYTFDHYAVGWNPEVSNLKGSTGTIAPGYDYGSYPLPTTITVGLNVSF